MGQVTVVARYRTRTAALPAAPLIAAPLSGRLRARRSRCPAARISSTRDRKGQPDGPDVSHDVVRAADPGPADCFTDHQEFPRTTL